jgi:hypothetical protein
MEQREKQEERSYMPPQLRQLRTDYFAKRYEKHGNEKTAITTQNDKENAVANASGEAYSGNRRG